MDDELLIRRSMKLAGESRGHIVKEAGDGIEALSLWPTFQPDVAFIDVLMPNMDGLELLKKIPKDSKAKIIVISAHDKINVEVFKNKGVKLFISKPFANIFHLIEQAEKFIKNEKG